MSNENQQISENEMSNENQQISETELRKVAKRRVQFRKSVSVHFALFLIVNLLLVVINYLSIEGDINLQNFWVLYPIFGWLIGVMIHLTAYFLYINEVKPLAKRILIFHIVAYIFTNILLIIVNLITNPAIFWVLFPLIFWGAGLVVHIVIYFLYLQEGAEKGVEGKSRKEKAIEREMQRIKSKGKE
ncbi:MAG: 2TM domain-containing protein [Promethearchaeia archaeon]